VTVTRRFTLIFFLFSPHELPPSSSFPPMNYHHFPTCPHVKQHMTI
jgi:hypothetical protein